MTITCMIVEDEPLAREVLTSYIKDLNYLSLDFTCTDAIEALNVLDSNRVDLIFLDINMPRLSGLSFYKSLNKKPKVIFTTAYPDHAVEGFELEATDYLLKPFSFERFVQAVNKVRVLMENDQPTSVDDFIMLKADKKAHKISYGDLRYFESIGDFVKVHLVDGKVLIINDTLRKLEEALPTNQFARVHKTYIISIGQVAYLEGNRMNLGETLIPIGQTYREKVNELFNKNKS